jgi:hypothetical protein
VRPLSGAPVNIVTRPIGDLIETTLDWKDSEMQFDVGDLLNDENEVTDKTRGAIITMITEKEMLSPGEATIGLSRLLFICFNQNEKCLL